MKKSTRDLFCAFGPNGPMPPIPVPNEAATGGAYPEHPAPTPRAGASTSWIEAPPTTAAPHTAQRTANNLGGGMRKRVLGAWGKGEEMAYTGGSEPKGIVRECCVCRLEGSRQ